MQSNCFPQKGCTGWLEEGRLVLYSRMELAAQYGKVVGRWVGWARFIVAVSGGVAGLLPGDACRTFRRHFEGLE